MTTKLKRYLVEHEITQRKLEKLLQQAGHKLNLAQINRVVNGKSDFMVLTSLVPICNTLNITPNDVVEGNWQISEGNYSLLVVKKIIQAIENSEDYETVGTFNGSKSETTKTCKVCEKEHYHTVQVVMQNKDQQYEAMLCRPCFNLFENIYDTEHQTFLES